MTKIPNFWENDILVDKTKRFDCVGCGNCAITCKNNSISLRYDSEGFLYPTVEEKKCVNCGLCRTACPIINITEKNNSVLMVIGGHAKDSNVLLHSTSGGFVYELSRAVIQKGGSVFGVAYNSDFSKAVYMEACTLKDLTLIAGTKYIQNEKNFIFVKIKEKLEDNSLVLFTGCPCDVAALKTFLKKSYKNLLTCEIACMGATSNKLLESFKLEQEEQEGSKITYINMRSKKYGWYVASLHEKFENGKEVFLPFYGTELGLGFLNFSRPSCYECKFRGKNTSPDFKTGDYWGVKQHSVSWNSNGSSCTIIGTEEGINFFKENMSNTYEYEELDSSILNNNPSFYENKSSKQIDKRDLFVSYFLQDGLKAACKKSGSFGFWPKKYMPIFIQPYIKKIVHKLLDK